MHTERGVRAMSCHVPIAAPHPSLNDTLKEYVREGVLVMQDRGEEASWVGLGLGLGLGVGLFPHTHACKAGLSGIGFNESGDSGLGMWLGLGLGKKDHFLPSHSISVTTTVIICDDFSEL